MLVSFRHRLVILSTPKCASVSLERALGEHMDMVMHRHPTLKHTYFRKYDRFIRPYLESYGGDGFETVCLFREPVDWLASWWRYRSRGDVPDRTRSTRGMAFSQFVSDYLDAKTPPADIGRQSRFVSNREGGVGVDRLFRYDRLDGFVSFLEARLQFPIELGHLNRSPERPPPAPLPDALLDRAREEMAMDFDIYENLAL